MKLPLLIGCSLLLCPLLCWSQHTKIVGRLYDLEAQQPLDNAIVLVLVDSTRSTQVLTDVNGFFYTSLSPGRYKLSIRALGYRPFIKSLIVSTNDTAINISDIIMQREDVMLKTVEIVQKKAPIVLKKDTLEFNANGYRVREYSVLETLLRKLPGITIDPDGTIKVNGETVEMLLIDGRPFLGKDLKTATQHLPADIVDRVQLIDRKPDEAQFIGIENGRYKKVLNLVLKKSRMNKFLGKVASAIGTEGRYMESGIISRFREDEQISVIADINNMSETGIIEDGRPIVSESGFVKCGNAAVNYSRDITNKLKINSSYTFQETRRKNNQESARQNLLSDTTYYYNQQMWSSDLQRKHTINSMAEYRPDSMSFFNSTIDLSYSRRDNVQSSIYETLADRLQNINSGIRSNVNTGDYPGISAKIMFAKKFIKPGRAMSFNIGYDLSSNTDSALLFSTNTYQQDGNGTSSDTINQHIHRSNNKSVINLGFYYVEPLSKRLFIDLAYNASWAKSYMNKSTFDYNMGNDNLGIKNDSLSNAFKNMNDLQTASILLRQEFRGLKTGIGMTFQFGGINSNNLSHSHMVRQQIKAFAPFAFLNQVFKNNANLRFSYSGSAQQPDVFQLQPVLDNSNPLYVRMGNQNLKSTFVHSANLTYNMMSRNMKRALFANVYITITQWKITDAVWFDSIGRQIAQPVNLNGSRSVSGNLTNTFMLMQGISANSATIFSINRDANYINGVAGKIRNLNAAESFTINYNSSKGFFDLSLSAKMNYSSVHYSEAQGANTNYFDYDFLLSYCKFRTK